MTPEMAHKIARYLFMHKWLAVHWSEGMEELLVREIMEAVAEDEEGE